MTTTALKQQTAPIPTTKEQEDAFRVPNLIDQHFICSLFNIKAEDIL